MSSDACPFPVALSRLGDGDSHETQNTRAIRWLLKQEVGPIALVTPRRKFTGKTLSALAARADTTHLTWRGLSPAMLDNRRIVYAWPDRQHLNDLWGVRATALVVIEWNESHSAEWIADASPDLLLPGVTLQPPAVSASPSTDLPEDVASILTSTAACAAGYSGGLKWNEEDKLKADMMNRPARWTAVTVEQVRAKCRELGMRPNDIDTIADFVQRRKDGRRFNVGSSYSAFHFGD